MMPSSDSPLERMISANSRWRGDSSVSSSSPLMPITAFIGVRISWLIVARNEPLAALASSAMRVCSSSWVNRCALADRDRRLLRERLRDAPVPSLEGSNLVSAQREVAVDTLVDDQRRDRAAVDLTAALPHTDPA